MAVLDAKDVDILRFATAGSVDDGKSSLIGRLLYDTKSILDDQLRAIESQSRSRGNDHVELALLTDGLRAEREQNITIDVAYRYFSTAKRRFIIADTPGHVQYTRNMATGASNVDLAIVLVDARKGVFPQSKRHTTIASIFGIKNFIIAVNKMDLVDFSEERFNEIQSQFFSEVGGLDLGSVQFIPISALLGDNIVSTSPNTPWYGGPNLLEHLETVDLKRTTQGALRIPVQYVIRPNQEFRGFAGEVLSGSIQVGDMVKVYPACKETTVRSLRSPDGVVQTAERGTPVVVELSEEIDLGRGAMIASPNSPPTPTQNLKASVCWFGESPAKPGQRLILAHGTRRVSATLSAILKPIQIDSEDETGTNELKTNQIAIVSLQTSEPIFVDRFKDEPSNGLMVLIDPISFVTVGAAVVAEPEVAKQRLLETRGQLVKVFGPESDQLASDIAPRVNRFERRVIVLQRHLLPEDDGPLCESLLSQGFHVVVTDQEHLDRFLQFDSSETTHAYHSLEEAAQLVLDTITREDFTI